MVGGDEIPLCETKEILNKLKNIANDQSSEPPKQIPRLMIRSEKCQCQNKDKPLKHEELQKIRAAYQNPPQSFDKEHLLESNEKRTLNLQEEKEKVPDKNDITNKDVPVPSDNKQNLITIMKMCKGLKDEEPEVKALLKEGKIPPNDNDEVCTKDPKTGNFVCYKVGDGGRVLKQFTEPQPLPEERRVEPHPIIPLPKPSNSYELRGSNLFVGCLCLKRNGMQHDCPRTHCQGKRECLKFPAPVCQPSGLAPPIIKVSPIKTAIEPECGPKKKVHVTQTEMEKRKVLLDYARAQYQAGPPSSTVPCKYHKKGFYIIKPTLRVVGAQTDGNILEFCQEREESANEINANGKPDDTKKEKTAQNIEKKPYIQKTAEGENEIDEEKDPKPTKIDETLKKLEKDLNLK